MDLFQRLRKIDIPLFFMTYIGGPDEFSQFFFELCGVCIFFQQDEGVEVMGNPSVHPLLAPKGVECRHRDQEIELEIGIFRHILQDTSNNEFMPVVKRERLAYGIFAPEIFIGYSLRDEEGKGFFQSIGITNDEGIGEDILKIRICTDEPGFAEQYVLILVLITTCVPKVPAPPFKSCRITDFGKIFLESGSKKGLSSGKFEVSSKIMGVYSVYAVGVIVESVEGQFESNIQKHENADDEADRKACNVDKRIKFVSFDVPQCDFYEVFNHDSSKPDG